MGYTNSHPAFVVTMKNLQKRWEHLEDDKSIKDCGSKVIADNKIVIFHDGTFLEGNNPAHSIGILDFMHVGSLCRRLLRAHVANI
jgi:hypothetical protein